MNLAVAAGEPLHTDFLDVSGVETAPLLAKPSKKKGSQLSNDMLYGFINAIVGAPTMISFAAIIFQVGFEDLSTAVSEVLHV